MMSFMLGKPPPFRKLSACAPLQSQTVALPDAL